jgi:hypothetical protein
MLCGGSGGGSCRSRDGIRNPDLAEVMRESREDKMNGQAEEKDGQEEKARSSS